MRRVSALGAFGGLCLSFNLLSLLVELTYLSPPSNNKDPYERSKVDEKDSKSFERTPYCHEVDRPDYTGHANCKCEYHP